MTALIFVRGNDDILSVDIANVKIRQRSDDTMGITFSITPKQALALEEFFNKFATGEKFYFNISHKQVTGQFITGDCLQ